MTLERVSDPSAGSPAKSLLRLLLPSSDEFHKTSKDMFCNAEQINLQMIHRITQSVGATGGVYEGQRRNQRELMARTCQECLAEINSCNYLPPSRCTQQITPLFQPMWWTRWVRQRNARAAQKVRGHHRPVIAIHFLPFETQCPSEK